MARATRLGRDRATWSTSSSGHSSYVRDRTEDTANVRSHGGEQPLRPVGVQSRSRSRRPPNSITLPWRWLSLEARRRAAGTEPCWIHVKRARAWTGQRPYPDPIRVASVRNRHGWLYPSAVTCRQPAEQQAGVPPSPRRAVLLASGLVHESKQGWNVAANFFFFFLSRAVQLLRHKTQEQAIARLPPSNAAAAAGRLVPPSTLVLGFLLEGRSKSLASHLNFRRTPLDHRHRASFLSFPAVRSAPIPGNNKSLQVAAAFQS